MQEKLVNTNNSIDIDELLAVSDANIVETTSTNDGLIVTDDNDIAENVVHEKAEEYDGPGAIVDREEYEAGRKRVQGKGIELDGIKAETYAETKKYMNEMDAKIEEQKKIIEKMKEEGVLDKDVNPEEDVTVVGAATAPNKKPATKKAAPQEVVNIYIDRAQVGELSFTPEQQKKIEYSSKINIVETTDKHFKSIKIKRRDAEVKGDEALTIIKKAFERSLSPFIAIGSGYLGKMGNCSVADVMNLGRHIDSGRNLTSELERWQLLYKKMKYCSIGLFKTFDEFLKNTAYDDYENLQYALICASFPDKTKLDFTCPKCKTKFTKSFSNKDFLITDQVDEKMQETVSSIVNADTFIERAKEIHENALFNTVTRISLNDDDNSVLLDMVSPSAYDAIYRTYKELNSETLNDENYEAYTYLIKYIKTAYIATGTTDDGEFEYTAFTDPNNIFKILFKCSDLQLNKIGLYMSESYMSHRYTYGVKDVVCENPKCKEPLGNFPVNMDQLLFLKVRPQ